MTDIDIKKITKVIGYSFSDISLIRTALTHPSFSSDTNQNYERLEFLGDRVLGLIVSDLLYKYFVEEKEGDLAKRLSYFVRREFVAKIANEIGINEFIILAQSEKDSGGQNKPAILCDILEAVIGAIFIDGGYKASYDFIYYNWGKYLDEDIKPFKDAKTDLQEKVQSLKLSLPVYELVSVEGPDHDPKFTMSVKIDGYEKLEATGKSKKLAEQKVAKKMLEKLDNNE